MLASVFGTPSEPTLVLSVSFPDRESEIIAQREPFPDCRGDGGLWCRTEVVWYLQDLIFQGWSVKSADGASCALEDLSFEVLEYGFDEEVTGSADEVILLDADCGADLNGDEIEEAFRILALNEKFSVVLRDSVLSATFLLSSPVWCDDRHGNLIFTPFLYLDEDSDFEFRSVREVVQQFRASGIDLQILDADFASAVDWDSLGSVKDAIAATYAEVAG